LRHRAVVLADRFGRDPGAGFDLAVSGELAGEDATGER
jgi:hypothetical protein